MTPDPREEELRQIIEHAEQKRQAAKQAEPTAPTEEPAKPSQTPPEPDKVVQRIAVSVEALSAELKEMEQRADIVTNKIKMLREVVNGGDS